MSGSKGLILTLDLGGTRFRVALADQQGKLLNRYVALTRTSEGRDQAIKRITSALRQSASAVGFSAILGLGVAAAGPLDPVSGILFTPPSLPGWDKTPLKSIWEQEFQIPVSIGNDANLAALGEHKFGAGRGVDHLVYITVSTGIGGGVILNGELLLGAMGLAAEIGHMTIERYGPRCNCGNLGCLEALASGTAIARMAVDRISSGETSTIAHLVAGDLSRVTAKSVATAARSGDPLAKEIMHTAGANLGIGVVNLLHLFNPHLVIIGGGVSQAGELLFEPVRQVVAQRAMPNFREKVRIIPSALGDDAGLLGAVALVLEQA